MITLKITKNDVIFNSDYTDIVFTLLAYSVRSDLRINSTTQSSLRPPHSRPYPATGGGRRLRHRESGGYVFGPQDPQDFKKTVFLPGCDRQ